MDFFTSIWNVNATDGLCWEHNTMLQKHNSFMVVSRGFWCLGWIVRQQQPAVLLSTSNDFRLNDNTVRCHFLQTWNPPLNEFCWTVVERPQTVCPRSRARCQCNQLHWQEFPLANILEVAVKKGRGNLLRICSASLFQTHLVQLTSYTCPNLKSHVIALKGTLKSGWDSLMTFFWLKKQQTFEHYINYTLFKVLLTSLNVG